MKKVWLILATGFGAGYAPAASGTFGTLPAVLFVYWLRGISPFWYLILTIAIIGIGIKAADVAEKHFNQKDSGKIVIDEIAGFFVTMFMVPVHCNSLVAGFLLFRLFDIVKPPPARRIDGSDMGGLSVVLDDVAAGLYSCIALQILRLFWLS